MTVAGRPHTLAGCSETGRCTGAPPVFVKQYGARRTGTNLVRWVLTQHFPDVRVLMHILGSKHGPPSDLVRLADQDWRGPARDLVRDATLQVPAETTDLDDAAQRSLLQALAEPLIAALRAGDLRYVVSIKEPYAWMASLLRMRGWLQPRRDLPLPNRDIASLRAACDEFNACYRAWFDLLQQFPGRGMVVRYERLLTAPTEVLAEMEACLGVTRSARAGAPLPIGIVVPAHWDHVPPGAHFEPFETGLYAEHRYLERLGADVRALVAESIDWDLFADRGYRPLPD